MNDKVIDRVEKIRKELGISQIFLAKVMGVTGENYSIWKKGITEPKSIYLKKIPEKWSNYNIKWILTGEGLMKTSIKVKDDIVNEPSGIYKTSNLNDKLIAIFEFALKTLREDN